MKVLSILLAITLAALSGWWFGRRHDHASSTAQSTASERQILRYQSPMHPWVKSQKPGKCTVCGMELVPVYDEGHQHVAAKTDIVMLPEGSPSIAAVKSVEVKRAPLLRTLRVAGTIDDDESKHRVLSAYTGGRIEKLYVNYEGADVQAGQPLATYYSKDLLAAVREYKSIYKQGPSPMLTSLEMRLRQLGMTEAQVAQAHERKESDIFVEILAPATGTVTKRYVYEGQYVDEGEKLFEMGDFTTMWFNFIAYEQDLPYLKVGLPVTISTPSLPGRTLSSTIKFINPNLDGATRSARVRVEVQNPVGEAGLHRRHEVLHKLYADALVSLEAPEVVAVPRNAVLWAGSNPRVYVDRGGGAYQQRRVILGRAGDEVWEVLEGVKPGERVVASGNMLIDGQAQLNYLGAAEEEAPLLSDAAMQMSPAEHLALEGYLQAVAAVTDALADDNLEGYNAALAKLPEAPHAITQAPPPPAADLEAARRNFLPLSQAVADHARMVRGHFPKLRVFRCPMSDRIAKGAPENAKWIQFTSDLRNPYMGKEMLECGVEVK